MQGVLADFKAAFERNGGLAFLNGLVEELLHAAALQADKVIMVTALVEFKNRFVRFEMMAHQQAGLFKLCEHPIDRGQARVRALFEQQAVDVFGGQVAHVAAFEEFKYAQPRQGGFETLVF